MTNEKKFVKKRSEIRFEKEAKALLKNLEKRKKQKMAREKLKAEKLKQNCSEN